MSYLSAEVISDIQANPSHAQSYYNLVKSDFKNQLGPAFATQPEDHIQLAFCCLVAFEMKPYGASAAVTLADCLASLLLNCFNYVALAWQLFILNWPSSTTVIDAVGWDGGAVGNHVQMFASTGASVGMLFDPTYAIFTSYCSPQGLIEHYNFNGTMSKSMFSWDQSERTALANAGTGSDVSSQAARVLSAIQNGTYKFSDFLYQWRGWSRYSGYAESGNWPTPRAQVLYPP